MEWEQKPTSLRDVADLFPPHMRESPYILIAGGAAVDLATCRDVDIFFFGPNALQLWEEWRRYLFTQDYDAEITRQFPVGDYDLPPSESGYFINQMTERHCVELPEWGDEIDVVVRHGFHPDAKGLLNSFDICQAQVGYRLNGEMVTGDEFDPSDTHIRLSQAGKRAIDHSTGKALAKIREKSKQRLDKYSRKLGLDVHADSYYYSPWSRPVEGMPKYVIDKDGEWREF